MAKGESSKSMGEIGMEEKVKEILQACEGGEEEKLRKLEGFCKKRLAELRTPGQPSRKNNSDTSNSANTSTESARIPEAPTAI